MKTMKKSVARILVLAMAICLMVSLAIPAAATAAFNEKIVDAKKGVVQIDVVYVEDDTGWEDYLGWGTGFLINEDTLVTCHHVIDGFSNEWYAERAYDLTKVLGREVTPQKVKDNLELRVSVLRDVHVKATIKQASAEMDFAILTLDEKIYNRSTLPLRKSSTLSQTEAVYALGFPGNVSSLDDQPYYDADDVTITTGNVNKVTRGDFPVKSVNAEGKTVIKNYKNVDIVEHSAIISGGNSGGPLVDMNGNVVGINAAGDDAAVINIAVSTDAIMQTMDALGIKYTEAKEEAPAPTEAPTEATEATEAPTTVATEAPTTVATEAPTTEATAPVKVDDNDGGSMTTILIVAAIAVVAVIIIVVVVMSKGKKKAPAYTAPAAPTAPTGGFTAPAYTAPMGAGETTVLGGDAGETTILSRAANGGTLIRKRTNETITINAERFIIGRERKTANYCIADNTSISRSHVTLVVKNGTTYLVDMNAANGTYVNGVKALANQEIALKTGDKIKLSDEEFEFRG